MGKTNFEPWEFSQKWVKSKQRETEKIPVVTDSDSQIFLNRLKPSNLNFCPFFCLRCGCTWTIYVR